MSDSNPTLLELPCDFPIKAFGHSDIGLDLTVVSIVRRHAPDLAEGAVMSRTSGGGKYTAITVTVRAQSKIQLDAIYQDLSACPEVIMVL